jgi:L-malate glycosyltransferase
MTICYTGAKNLHTERWVTYFAACGHEVHLIIDEPVDYEGVIIHSLDLKVDKTLSYFFKKLFKIRKLVRQIKPDILHAHTITTEGYICALTGFHPFVVTIWGSDIYLRPHTGFDERLFTQLVLKRADLVTADSQDQINAAVALGGRASKCEVIQWGLDLNLFQPMDATAIRSQLGFGEDPVILSPRKFTQLYNIDVLLRAFKEVLVTLPTAKMILTGSGAGEEEIKALVHHLGLDGQIHFTGYVDYDELPLYLAVADVSVSVPSSDGTAMSVLEALACEVPLIVSDLPSNHEWIKDGVNGLIVPVQDEKALTGCLLEVLQNRQTYRDRFKEQNRNLVHERADREANMKNMDIIYQRLIEGRKK